MAVISQVQQLVNDAKIEIKEVTTADVQRMLANKEAVLLIDVRDDSEWAVDHLPTAIHLSRGRLEFLIENAAPTFDRKLVLYCGGGSRSALAAQSLQKMGYSDVSSMAGGYRDWKASGYKLVQS
jgi:rhodanese-related sulfurtransferase